MDAQLTQLDAAFNTPNADASSPIVCGEPERSLLRQLDQAIPDTASARRVVLESLLSIAVLHDGETQAARRHVERAFALEKDLPESARDCDLPAAWWWRALPADVELRVLAQEFAEAARNGESQREDAIARTLAERRTTARARIGGFLAFEPGLLHGTLMDVSHRNRASIAALAAEEALLETHGRTGGGASAGRHRVSAVLEKADRIAVADAETAPMFQRMQVTGSTTTQILALARPLGSRPEARIVLSYPNTVVLRLRSSVADSIRLQLWTRGTEERTVAVADVALDIDAASLVAHRRRIERGIKRDESLADGEGDEKTHCLLQSHANPVVANWRRIFRTVDEPARELTGPAVLLTGGGMMDGGPVLEYVNSHLTNERNTLLLNETATR